MYEYYAALQDMGSNSGATAALAQDAMQCSGTLVMAQAKVQMLLDEIKAKDLTNTKTEMDLLNHLTRRMATLPGERVIVLVSPGFILHDPRGDYDRGEASRKLVEEAARARITINTLDARGVEVIVRGGDASQRRTSANSGSFDSFGALLAGETLAEIADGTGGKLFHNNNDIEEGFRELGAAPEYEYILGFSPQNLKMDGGFHQLKVVVKGNDLTVQARRGYYAPNREADAAEQAAAEIDEAMFSREELLDIPCEVQVQYFKTAPSLARLSVVAKIDLHGLHFRKADGRSNDVVTFVTGVFSLDGNLIKGWSKTVDLRFRDELFQARLANGLSEKTSLDVPPGNYVVRLVVRDSEGQRMSALNKMVEVR